MKYKHTDGIISNEGYDPRNRGVTFSDDPKHPLWNIIVRFDRTPPMKEVIRAPTHQTALAYARRKYPEAMNVEYVGKAVPIPGQNGVGF